MLTERLQDFGVIKASIDRVQGIRAQRLPFYKDHILCDVALDRMPRSRIWLSCLYGPDGVHALTGASVVIHGLNRQLKPDLSDPDIQAAYLRLFCRFVHGQEGPFEIISGSGIVKDHATAAPSYDDEDKLWSASVLYGGALFDAKLRVQDDGHVKMEDDTPVAEVMRRAPEMIYDGAIRKKRPQEGM